MLYKNLFQLYPENNYFLLSDKLEDIRYLPMEIYVEVIVTMMQCIIKVFVFCSAAFISLLQLPIASALVQS